MNNANDNVMSIFDEFMSEENNMPTPIEDKPDPGYIADITESSTEEQNNGEQEVTTASEPTAVQASASDVRDHLSSAPSLEAITEKYAYNSPDVSLRSSGMLVSLSIRVWSANKRDKKASAEIAMSKHAKAKLARVNKTLLSCPELDAVKKIADEVRHGTHYPLTMSYMRGALDYLPTEHYMEYVQRMETSEREFNQSVDEFCKKYSFLILKQHSELGDLFDEADYPSIDEVRRKFALSIDYCPVPDNDFATTIATEQARQLEDHFGRRERERMNRMLQSKWEELYETIVSVLGKIAYDNEDDRKQLPAGSKRLYDSTVASLKRQCDLLDGFNVANDPVLADATRTIRECLKGVDADTLRTNDNKRRDVRTKLAELTAKLGG